MVHRLPAASTRSTPDGRRTTAEMLSALRSAGGRLSFAELDFELRWRGVVRSPGTTWGAHLDRLCGVGLVRGPLTRSRTYELTTPGWDAATRFDTRDLAPAGPPRPPKSQRSTTRGTVDERGDHPQRDGG